MSVELSLIELYNPLYLFPIVGVLLCAILVYAFGFKQAKQPNFDDLDSDIKKRDNNVIQRKKKSIKESVNKVTNGHVTGAAKVVDKRSTPKKVSVTDAKPSSVSNDKVVNSNKVNTKKDKNRNRKSDEQNVEIQDIDNNNSGEWVELVSKKERKNRKLKEEQLLNVVQNGSHSKTSKTSPKKQKKGKENRDKSDKNVSLDSNLSIDKTEVEDKPKENTVSVKNDKNLKLSKNEKQYQEEIIAEDPDIYEVVKDQRQQKKSLKTRNNKRNSESETNQKVEPIAETETTVKDKDKLTASIVANYEANDQNKPDSTSSANNKKKKDKKDKKKQTQANNASVDKPIVADNKTDSTQVKDVSVEKSESAAIIPTSNEVKQTDDDDFKVAVSKKRRARRE